MRFGATMGSVIPKPAKMHEVGKTWNSAGRQVLAGGELVLTVTVARPAQPTRPEKPSDLSYVMSGSPAPGPEPVEVAIVQDEEETAAAFKRRQNTVHKDHEKHHAAWVQRRDQHQRALDRKARLESEYAGELATWREQVAALGALYNGYAQLAATGALMSGMPVEVELKLDRRWLRTYLPGFDPGAMLRSMPATVALAPPDLDDEPMQLAEGNTEDELGGDE